MLTWSIIQNGWLISLLTSLFLTNNQGSQLNLELLSRVSLVRVAALKPP